VRETVSAKGSCKAPLFCFAATACPPAPCEGCRVVPPRASCPGNRREEGREGERGLANVRSCQAVGFTPPMLPFCTGTPDGLFSPVSLLSPSLPLSLSPDPASLHSASLSLGATNPQKHARRGGYRGRADGAADGRSGAPELCAPRSLTQVFIFPGGAADGPPRGPRSLHNPPPIFWRAVTAAPCLAAAVRLPLRPEILPCKHVVSSSVVTLCTRCVHEDEVKKIEFPLEFTRLREEGRLECGNVFL
jgi:hypothetical protein